MDEKLVERGWGRDDYLDTIRSLNGVIKRQRHSLKALHRSHNISGKVCAGLARDMQAVRSEQREAATALTLAQARIRELETALAAADAIRVAQRRYMADRGNEELGKAVGAAVVAFDAIRALTIKEAPMSDITEEGIARAPTYDGSIEVRLDDKGGVDEIVGLGVICHIERLSNGTWFVSLTRPDQTEEAFWLAGKGSVEVCHTEHRTAPATGPNAAPWTLAAAIRKG